MPKAIATITLRTPKPRNPLVAASRFRHAGAHGAGATRQQAQRGLQRELARLRTHSP